MKRPAFLAGLMALAVMAPSTAHAEQGEWGLFIAGGVIFPNFSPTDDVTFDLVSGFGGLGVTYGLHDNLWLDVRGTVTAYRGQTRQQVTFRSAPLEGNLFFASTQFHPTVGLQLNVFPGMNFSPYVFARGGFIFSTFRQQQFLNDAGMSFAGVEFEDSSELQWTVSGGLSLEYRFYQFLIVGLEPTFTKAFGSGRNDWFASGTLKVTVLLGDW